MEWTFTAEVVEWRGPAPYLFVAMPEDVVEGAVVDVAMSLRRDRS